LADAQHSKGKTPMGTAPVQANEKNNRREKQKRA